MRHEPWRSRRNRTKDLAEELRKEEMLTNTPAMWRDAQLPPTLDVCDHCDLVILGTQYLKGRKKFHKFCYEERFNVKL